MPPAMASTAACMVGYCLPWPTVSVPLAPSRTAVVAVSPVAGLFWPRLVATLSSVMLTGVPVAASVAMAAATQKR